MDDDGGERGGGAEAAAVDDDHVDVGGGGVGFGEEVAEGGEEGHVDFLGGFVVAGFRGDVVDGGGEVGLVAVAGVEEDFGHEGGAAVVEEVEHSGVLDEGGKGYAAEVWGLEA